MEILHTEDNRTYGRLVLKLRLLEWGVNDLTVGDSQHWRRWSNEVVLHTLLVTSVFTASLWSYVLLSSVCNISILLISWCAIPDTFTFLICVPPWYIHLTDTCTSLMHSLQWYIHPGDTLITFLIHSPHWCIHLTDTFTSLIHSPH